ncbi:hypothetical protein J6590_040357 [Homalodisca vitripennis]|nr:hypothetical protein J6590_040357 [Homalodisca vitripennis]
MRVMYSEWRYLECSPFTNKDRCCVPFKRDKSTYIFTDGCTFKDCAGPTSTTSAVEALALCRPDSLGKSSLMRHRPQLRLRKVSLPLNPYKAVLMLDDS